MIHLSFNIISKNTLVSFTEGYFFKLIYVILVKNITLNK